MGDELVGRLRPRRGRGIAPPAVPRSPGDIDARWLTAALCRRVPGARVVEVRPADASIGTTSRVALEVTYDPRGAAAGLPTAVFAKCASRLGQRLMLGLGGFIEGEPGFYAHVRPGLDIEAPIGYHAAVDRRSWRSVVLIEDVRRTRGARFWGPQTQITRGQIEDLLAQTAAWHAALWESPRLATWPWLKTPDAHVRLIDALIGVANRLPAGARRARAVIPPGLRDRQADLYEAMRRSMRAAAGGPRTYLHGDLHIANTYLTRGGRAGVADWQVGMQGSWANDYAYLVATALEVEDRRAWEEGLLDFYLERLAAGGAPISRPAAWDAYRRAVFYPYFTWVYTIGRSRLQPAFQPDEVSLTMIERIAAAIDDLHALRTVGL